MKKLSNHAEIRCQQRGMKSIIINLIGKLGRPVRKPGGALEYMITKKEKKKICMVFKQAIQALDKVDGKAILVSADNEDIITVYNLFH